MPPGPKSETVKSPQFHVPDPVNRQSRPALSAFANVTPCWLKASTLNLPLATLIVAPATATLTSEVLALAAAGPDTAIPPAVMVMAEAVAWASKALSSNLTGNVATTGRSSRAITTST